jgi:hypothetical protein
MIVKKPETILQELRAVREERAKLLRAQVQGELHIFELMRRAGTAPEYSPITWILRAHLGTLDKLDGLFVRDGEYETFELLAITRNLFENLVWIRLFNKDMQYGLIFYEQFLTQQMQNMQNMITKVKDEALRFDAYDKRDDMNLDEAFADVIKDEATREQMIRQAMERHRKASAELDRQVRRDFTIYAAAAQFNGYGYQSFLLREKVLPKHQKELESIEAELSAYRGAKSALLSPTMLKQSDAKWYWEQRAIEIGMGPQYDFLYRYTSKLLHATPMNLITEKSLSASESLTMLEYAFITFQDLFDEIEAFRYPGQIRALYIDVGDKNDGDDQTSSSEAET